MVSEDIDPRVRQAVGWSSSLPCSCASHSSSASFGPAPRKPENRPYGASKYTMSPSTIYECSHQAHNSRPIFARKSSSSRRMSRSRCVRLVRFASYPQTNLHRIGRSARLVLTLLELAFGYTYDICTCPYSCSNVF